MIVLQVTGDGPSLSCLRDFYSGLYTAEFPDADERESLENMENYLRLKAEGWYGPNNYHILLARDEDGGIIGGVVADYLAEPNCGVIEFIVIDSALRGRGLGRRLLSEITACFEDDARRAGYPALAGIAGEVNDPYRRCDLNEHLDGFARLATWDRYGFGLLDFPYVQPSLGVGQDAVRGLGLMFKPLREDLAREVPSALVQQIVREFQIWAMRIVNPDEDAVFAAMRDHLLQKDGISLLDMREYICEENDPPFVPVELANEDPRFPDFAELYTSEFDDDRTSVDISAFRGGSQSRTEPFDFNYWLWGLDAPGSSGFSGFASFFGFPRCGFGGYVALSGVLRGKGMFRRFLRLMEKQIVRSNAGASGWYVECEPDSPEVAVFQHCGFTRIPMTYLQPRLHTDTTGESEDKVLEILYKPFGRRYTAAIPSPDRIRTDLRDIIMVVYRLDSASAERQLHRMKIFTNSSTPSFP